MQTSWGSGKGMGWDREGGWKWKGWEGRGEGRGRGSVPAGKFFHLYPWPNYYMRTSAQLFRSASREQDSIGMLYIQGF